MRHPTATAIAQPADRSLGLETKNPSHNTGAQSDYNSGAEETKPVATQDTAGASEAKPVPRSQLFTPNNDTTTAPLEVKEERFLRRTR